MGGKLLKLSGLGLVVVAGTCFGPGAQPFESGPIVQNVGARSATVVLHTAAVTMASADAARGRLGPVLSARRRHVFRLDGLEPGRAYRFSARSWIPGEIDAAREYAGSFRTAPEPGTGSVRFAAFGDSGKIPGWLRVTDDLPIGPAPWLQSVLPGRGHQWEVARAVQRQAPHLVLHLGDVVYPDGRRAHYAEAFFRPFAELLAAVPMYPAIGNHDLITENGAAFDAAFALPGAERVSGRRYYDFVHGPVRFVCLDTFSASLDAGSSQRRWLGGVLAAAREPWVVLFTHRPFWTASRSRDDADNAFLREQIHPLLAKHRVTLVLSGHDHLYERYALQDGVCYVVAGGGGKSLYELVGDPLLAASARRYSFVVVDAGERSMRLRALSENGDELDTWEAAPRR